jgi:hypothetical protein
MLREHGDWLVGIERFGSTTSALDVAEQMLASVYWLQTYSKLDSINEQRLMSPKILECSAALLPRSMQNPAEMKS